MSQLKGKRILIVDDECLIALHAEDLLLQMGAVPVGPATTVDEALALLSDQTFDAVLLDANLHNKSSEPIAQRLLAAKIPYVIVTGYGDVPWKSPNVCVVSKPYRDGDIANALRKALPSLT